MYTNMIGPSSHMSYLSSAYRIWSLSPYRFAQNEHTLSMSLVGKVWWLRRTLRALKWYSRLYAHLAFPRCNNHMEMHFLFFLDALSQLFPRPTPPRMVVTKVLKFGDFTWLQHSEALIYTPFYLKSLWQTIISLLWVNMELLSLVLPFYAARGASSLG